MCEVGRARLLGAVCCGVPTENSVLVRLQGFTYNHQFTINHSKYGL